MFAQIFCRYLRNNRIPICKNYPIFKKSLFLDSFIATLGSCVFYSLSLNMENSQQSEFCCSQAASFNL